MRPHHIAFGMADEDLSTEGLEPVSGDRRTNIGAGDFIALIQQDFGDATHANATDADKMDAANTAHLGHLVDFHTAVHRCHFITSRQISATVVLASGRACSRARSAICNNCSRLPSSLSRAASRSGFNSDCCTTRAAPARSRCRALAVWWSSTAWGKGTKMAPRPAISISLTVSAPERHSTRSAQP